MIGNDHFDEWIRKRWSGGGYGANNLHPTPAPLVAVLGLAGETGEAIDLIKKHIRDGAHPGEKLKLELGDVLHYLTVIAGSYGWTLDDLVVANMHKLKIRDEQKGWTPPNT